jgi:hypothetical protein
MLAEGGRLALDPAYRERQMAEHDALGQKGALSGLGRGLTAPISTIAGTGGDLWSLLNSTPESYQNNRTNRLKGQTDRNMQEVEVLRGAGASPADIQKHMAAYRKTKNRK